jgi:hypothetical protein
MTVTAKPDTCCHLTTGPFELLVPEGDARNRSRSLYVANNDVISKKETNDEYKAENGRFGNA